MVGRLAFIACLMLAPVAGIPEAALESNTALPAVTTTPTASSATLPAAVSATAGNAAPLEPRLAGLEPYKPEANKPVEDFFVVSIVSLPFTALWSVVGAAAVASISQKQFPPVFSNEAILSTAAIAVGSSLAIGLLSVSWGKGHSDKAVIP
jgi:hypothetical protein